MKINGIDLKNFRYVRDENRRPVGVVVVDRNGNCGWSLCHYKDRWNKRLGIVKAIARLRLRQPISEALRYSKMWGFLLPSKVERRKNFRRLSETCDSIFCG